jgi:hypothetical protein
MTSLKEFQVPVVEAYIAVSRFLMTSNRSWTLATVHEGTTSSFACKVGGADGIGRGRQAPRAGPLVHL